eukprot:8914802-Pyramimonas_sp.AAC.1
MARSLGMQGDGVRARVDLVRSCVCRSKKYSARQKFVIASCFTKAVFTSDRLQSHGYESDGKRPLCGGPDGLHHRLWCCQAPEVVEARQNTCSADIIAEA